MVLTPVLYRYHLGIIYCDINQRHILIHASFHSVQIRFQAHHWHIFNALFFQHQQGIFLLTDLCLFDVNLILLISAGIFVFRFLSSDKTLFGSFCLLDLNQPIQCRADNMKPVCHADLSIHRTGHLFPADHHHPAPL